MSFFGDLERFASDLYPYRWPIIIAAAVLLVMAVAFANRRGWHRALWRHKITTTLVVVPAVALAAAAGWYTLSPLWERSHLEEASPLEAVTVGVRPVEAEQAVIDSAEAAGGHSTRHAVRVAVHGPHHAQRTVPGRRRLPFRAGTGPTHRDSAGSLHAAL
jgi:FlaA1/EpsC-like NDP-sugar epimerase